MKKTNVQYTVKIVMKNKDEYIFNNVSNVDILLSYNVDVMYVEFPDGSRVHYHWSDIKCFFQEVQK